MFRPMLLHEQTKRMLPSSGSKKFILLHCLYSCFPRCAPSCSSLSDVVMFGGRCFRRLGDPVRVFLLWHIRRHRESGSSPCSRDFLFGGEPPADDSAKCRSQRVTLCRTNNDAHFNTIRRAYGATNCVSRPSSKSTSNRGTVWESIFHPDTVSNCLCKHRQTAHWQEQLFASAVLAFSGSCSRGTLIWPERRGCSFMSTT